MSVFLPRAFTISEAASKVLLATAVLGGMALCQPARADVVLFQTATLDPGAVALDNTLVLQGDGTTQGDGFSGGSILIGADFTITKATTLSSIGASFGDTGLTASSGSIFGAIVLVDPVTGLPTHPVETLASITLGDVVFTPTKDGDTIAALSVTLMPGTYGLVFGSGLFGATGVADLLHDNDAVGSPSVFINQFAPFAQDASDTDVRLFVTAVPEPASIAGLFSAAAMLAATRRRRRPKTAAI